MKRKSKKYHTEKQILNAIEKSMKDVKDNLWKAEQLENASRAHFKIAAVCKEPESFAHTNQGRIDRDDAILFRKKATRIIEVRLKKLKMVLAEFQTMPMALLGDDIGATMPRHLITK